MLKFISKTIFVKFLGQSNKTTWYPTNEPPLKVGEMADSHLLNACRMFKPLSIKWATLDKERRRRGLKEKSADTVDTVLLPFIDEESDFC